MIWCCAKGRVHQPRSTCAPATTNMGLARQFNLPVVLIGDIDRGGVLASIFGTWALLDDADQALLRGYVINKFRGVRRVAAGAGRDQSSHRAGRPGHHRLVARCLVGWRRCSGLGTMLAVGADQLRVAVVGLPQISNATDVDALAAEPGVDVQMTTSPDAIAAADLVILPGTRSTLDDLSWLRDRGLAEAIADPGAARRPSAGDLRRLSRCRAGRIRDAAGWNRLSRSRSTGWGCWTSRLISPEKKLGRPHGEWQGHLVDWLRDSPRVQRTGG